MSEEELVKRATGHLFVKGRNTERDLKTLAARAVRAAYPASADANSFLSRVNHTLQNELQQKIPDRCYRFATVLCSPVAGGAIGTEYFRIDVPERNLRVFFLREQ